MSSKIKNLKAKEILDSKGEPTVEVKLTTESGVFTASVPSGISKGKYEAVELRDGGTRHQGKGVLAAVRNVNQIIAPKLIDRDATKQEEIDRLMIEMDGTENKSKLGANAILAVSIAICRAGAEERPLWKWISELSRREPALPSPFILCIEGGLHGSGALDIQEFMIVTRAGSFGDKFRVVTKIHHTLRRILEKNYGELGTKTGIEGAFIPPLKKTEEALDLITEAISETGHENKVKFVLDVASSSFFRNEKYSFEGKTLNREELSRFYVKLYQKYPILAIEDPFAEDDWEGWKMFMSNIKNQLLVIGDDLTVTNQERFKKAEQEQCVNAVIIKPNQIGTVTETISAINLAKKFNWKTVISHRGGDTPDSFIADLAVGSGADFIKSGAPTKKERMAKYNRLLKIEEELK
ncbi:hypothetical protein LCGC14_0197270 [marine sediment metagenome]|uniref:phosphopyruvate hydratase n=1 Tax=marine sediment metagenome TaxID=412755 RepID=A0A0F9XMZ1_9ZZZZ|nr:phosphopyruvate hydratase [Candidatus Nealsonbacteria bacterium]